MTTTIGVLGGGISGLATAFHLARRLPASFPAKILLIEKNKRLGGWIQSENVNVTLPASQRTPEKEYSVVLESGPRTLRPRSLEMLELINLLDLESSLILIPYSHLAARNRYVYFPETGLTRLPSDVISLARSQFVHRASLGSLLPAAIGEPFKSANRPPGITDESFDDFMSRRFGSEFARRFGSSLIHGIYAADSRKLSMRATFGQVWDFEERGGGSVVRGMLRGIKPSSGSKSDLDLGNIREAMKGVSVYTFKGGMERISLALEHSLRDNPRVDIRTEDTVRSIRPSEGSTGILVETSSGTEQVSHLVSTLPLPNVSELLPQTHQAPYLTHNPHTTVHVVNLVFPPSSDPIHPPGFGYLVPRPKDGYSSATSPVLGCVFDSTVSSDQNPAVVTMMLGGPFPIQSTPLPLPVVLKILSTQLGRESLPGPIAYRYHIQRNCIPTPLVGHLDRVSEQRQALQKLWGGHLQVIGSGVGGVSLGDCVRDGRAAAMRITHELGFS